MLCHMILSFLYYLGDGSFTAHLNHGIYAARMLLLRNGSRSVFMPHASCLIAHGILSAVSCGGLWLFHGGTLLRFHFHFAQFYTCPFPNAHFPVYFDYRPCLCFLSDDG